MNLVTPVTGPTRPARAAAWLVVLSLGMVTVQAQVKLGLGSIRGFAGTVVDVPVTLLPKSDIVALQADFRHDASTLSLAPAMAGPAASGHMLLSSTPEPGLSRLLLYSPTLGALNRGEVARWPVTIAPQVYSGFYRLTLTNVMVATAAAQPLAVTNASGLIMLNPVFLRLDGGVDFYLNVTPDQVYLIQASTNLVDWLTLSTNVAVGPYLEFTEPGAADYYPYRFYRALQASP